MNLVSNINYIKLIREDGGPGGRKYVDPFGNRLSSVTTILDATKSKETTDALNNWRLSIGIKKATDITEEAAARGTIMHNYLERLVKGEVINPPSNIIHKQSFKMMNIILETYLKPNVTDIHGLETTLYYPELYAGTTDMVGRWKSELSIIDFKQTNKPKTDERVVDYKMQLAAYISAHNKVYSTNIQQGVILMCSKDFVPQHWVVERDELEYYTNKWWERVSSFYELI